MESLDELQKRLHLSEEWNMRLQAQIQELLRLPRSDVEILRSRMHNPDIAIPLLQCYDATIMEKQEENERVIQENQKLRLQLDSVNGELCLSRDAARTAEELLKETQQSAQQQQRSLEDMRVHAERDCQKLQQDLACALESESKLKHEVQLMRRQLTAAQEEAAQRQRDVAALEEAVRLAHGRLKSTTNEKDETLQQREVQRVQLQLLTKENEDKLHELERLRNRMVQALRQASENHAAHMRLVEEKHSEMVESLRTQLQTQDLELQKLRAKLARVDACGVDTKYGFSLRTTTELLESQTRQAQEIEMKRLYSELSALQLQRDDAVLRYEQLSTSLRREESERASAAHEEIQQLRLKLRDLGQQHEQLEKEHGRVKEELRVQREKSKSHFGDLQRARQERDQALRKSEEIRRALTNAEEACELCRQEAKEEVARERRRMEEQVKQHEEVLKELQLSKERAHTATSVAERRCDELRHQLTDTTSQIESLQSRLEKREREVEVLTLEKAHFQEAVRINQKQALESDEKVQQLMSQDKEKSRQLQELKLTVEQLKLEVARGARLRGRLVVESHARLS
ncbi:hypothetical protein ERJ75_001457800 [Trypanosoma vivax]|nr:hypothetical protein TRVL_03031 [Trypanosoma vivax]KAH8607019.1 hypothetical protein ERJ75_001457800 [Trypanosoma vivax]